MIDTSGKEITPVKYNLIDDNDFYNHRPAAALLNGKWGFINEKREEVIPFIYEDTTYFHKDYVAVKKDPGEVSPRQSRSLRHHPRRRSGEHDVTAVVAGSGTEVDDPVCVRHHGLVVIARQADDVAGR